MPSNDLIINVQQVGGYPLLDHLVGATDVLLVQQGGLGGPYKSITQDGLLGQVFERVNVGILPAPDNQGIASSYLITPLGQRQGFNWYNDEDGVQRFLQNGPAGYWSMVNTAGDLQWAVIPPGEKDDPIDTTAWKVIFDLTTGGVLTVGSMTISDPPAAPTDAVTMQWVQTNAVASFNARVGAVALNLADVTGVGGAPLASPHLSGLPTAPTAAAADNSAAIATTAFTQAAITSSLAAMVHVASFNARTGAVTLTLADVTGVGAAPLASPVFTGVPTAPTPIPADNSGALATTAFVHAAVVASTAGVASFNARTGAVTLSLADVTAAGGAPIVSPSFTGVPMVPTAAPGNNSGQIANTSWVMSQIAAVTAGVSTFNGRTGTVSLLATDVTGVGGALVVSPAFTGVPTAPTAAPGTNTTALATTAFVAAALTGAGRGAAEQVTVTGVNTLSPLSHSPTDALTTMQVVVNGRAFSGAAVPIPFTVAGNVITWVSTLYGIAPGDEVIARYQPA